MQLEFLAVGGLVNAVGVQRARQRLAALLEVGRQRAVHQAERIAIDQHLVLGVDGGDAVFHVEDGADGRFQDHVGDAGRIVLADHVAAVDLDFDMHPVVDQKDGRRRSGVAAIARELRVRFQRGGVAALQFDRELAADDAVGRHIGVAAGRQRHGGIEEGLGLRDHLVAARLVETLGPLAGLVRDRVGAVKGVVKTAPARVGGVERVARIGERHDQLGSADFPDLFVDIGCLDLLGRGLRQQISDLLQKCGVGVEVDRLALVGAVPVVDLRLQGVAEGKQLAISRRQIADDGGQSCPERVGRNPGFRGRFLGDEIKQDSGDLQSVDIDTIHDGFFSRETAFKCGFQGQKKQETRREARRSGAF